MAYNMKDGRIIATLLDFDLATFPDETNDPDEAVTQCSVSSPDAPVSVNGSASSTGGPEMSMDNKSAELSKASRECRRSGTTPFMSIQALDWSLSPFVHHLCHELESILYASVWYGVGYRWNAGVIPWTSEGHYRPVEILKEWRIGSLDEVVSKKGAFLLNPMSILKHMKHERLRRACLFLSYIFNQKLTGLRQLEMLRDFPDCFSKIHRTLWVDSEYIDKPVYPYFAKVWKMQIAQCQKTCCV